MWQDPMMTLYLVLPINSNSVSIHVGRWWADCSLGNGSLVDATATCAYLLPFFDTLWPMLTVAHVMGCLGSQWAGPSCSWLCCFSIQHHGSNVLSSWFHTLMPILQNSSSIYVNQLEKLEAVKVAWLVCLSLMILTGSSLLLLGQFLLTLLGLS